MYFYEVWVRSTAYRGSEPLTYHTDRKLARGSIVAVTMQKSKVWAVVCGEVQKPHFPTKPITTVADIPPLPAHLLVLAEEIAAYYATPMSTVMQLILPADPEPKKSRVETPHAEPQNIPPTLPPLTAQQHAAVVNIMEPTTYLLHGKTGSGKTRLYIEKTQAALGEGKSSIILTPEISLTSQLAQQFRRVYGERVVILHSGLTPRERRQAWLHILRSDEPKIVIGARSALFSPLKNIGLLVIDEAHEPAYKQEQAPYYHAVRVGSMLTKLHHALFVLGTATPTVTDYYIAERKHTPIISMTALATESLTSVNYRVVDLTDRSLLSRSQYISDPLIASIQNSLEKHEQSLLYLNRRGTARVILCDQCGWQALCPHCDLPLTYHADSHNVICHSCNYRGNPPVSCPECGNPSIVYKSAGTKSIVDEVTRLFPEARIQRFDTDNRKAERFEQHYEAIQKGDVDILVGTQLLAKGLDLPKLSTLGVITADSSLTMPDFSSNERTYQLLSQVLGRVGRGHRDSTAIVQTYNTDSIAIQAALTSDWPLFYKKELAERQKYHFPPFCFLLKLTCRRASQKAAEKAANDLKAVLLNARLPIEIEGPTPSFHEKIESKFQWQLVVKSKQRPALVQVIRQLPKSGWTYDIDPINLL